jgi:uncharacterized protein YdeI (YjbR/CyaY-like superfamily)
VKDHNEATFFETPAELRRWLEAHHTTEDELWVGSHRKSTGRPSLTWPQIVDELLCFGWIDGVRRSLPGERWAIRVTPRRKGSHWSAVNVRRVAELEAEGRMTDAGRRAFALRDTTQIPYTYEAPSQPLDPAYEARVRANPAAWSWLEAQAPSYRRGVAQWVMTAKQEATRERRLETLIEDSANGRFLKQYRYGRDRGGDTPTGGSDDG